MNDDPTAATVAQTDPIAATVNASGGFARPPTSGIESDDLPAFLEVGAEHYRVAEEIARGGMGRVRVARDRRLGRWVALKEVLGHDANVVRRFEREARITARLQHPSILSVYEAGVWPSGQPFYAMPLVRGSSLDAVIAATKTLADRVALVPNVLAVADAIAYAHDQRVIHRDLKPSNVLVGKFGETVVIDWGIAKSLDDPNESLPGHRGSGDGYETVDGAVIGTPAYMPPEQANGAVVDERADVYAIGALLAHVLAGVAPYTGVSAADVLAAVRTGPPVAVLARVPDAPPELVAIVDRAMAREKVDRYPSARELAADLRRFQTGQLVGAHRYSARQLFVRWARRHRATLAVAVGAVVVLAIGATLAIRNIVAERTRADALRVVAEDDRETSDSLTEFMLIDMHDKLTAVGKLELLDGAARRAAAYYAKRGDQSDAMLAGHATALSNIGDVLLQRNDLVGARTQYQAAFDMRSELAARAPTDRALQHGLAGNEGKLADVATRQHDLPREKQALEAALAIDDRLLGTDATDGAAQFDREGVLRAYAQLLQSSDLDGARHNAAESVAIGEQLAARDPKNARWGKELAQGHQMLGKVMHMQNDVAGAVAQVEAALAIAKRVADLEDSNQDLLDGLAYAHAELAQELQFAGDPARAVAEFRAAQAIYEQLLARDPTNVGHKSRLGAVHRAVGTALVQEGDTRGGLEELRAALPLLEEVAAHDRTNASTLAGLQGVHELIGKSLTIGGQPLLAIPELEAAKAMSDRALTLTPTDKRAQHTAALIHNELGEAFTASRDPVAAILQHQAALEIADKLHAADPSNASARSDQSSAHRGLGKALHAQQHDDEAIEEARAALAISEAQAVKDVKNAELAQRIAGLHELVADSQLARGHGHDAIAEYDAALVILKQLAAAAPTRTILQHEVERLTKKRVAATHAKH
jgi:tetratricopeptide (TPR) repeat protein